MIHRALLAAALFTLAGCYEAIEHQAMKDAGGEPGQCTTDDQCACNQRCRFVDGGHFCAAVQPTTCTHDPECLTGLVCIQTHRLGHNCGYLECQHPADAGH